MLVDLLNRFLHLTDRMVVLKLLIVYTWTKSVVRYVQLSVYGVSHATAECVSRSSFWD